MTAAEFKDAVWSILGNLALLYCVLIGVASILNMLPFWKDDTDPPKGRSDLKVYTDHRTGCQYIGTGSGGLTPRLDANGKQICQRKDESDNQRDELLAMLIRKQAADSALYDLPFDCTREQHESALKEHDLAHMESGKLISRMKGGE